MWAVRDFLTPDHSINVSCFPNAVARLPGDWSYRTLGSETLLSPSKKADGLGSGDHQRLYG